MRDKTVHASDKTGQRRAHFGKAPDNRPDKTDTANDNQLDNTMTRFLTLLLFVSVLASCRTTEKMTTTTHTRIDSVAVAVPVPGHYFKRTFNWADTLVFEDERLLVRIVPNHDRALHDSLDKVHGDVRTLSEACTCLSGACTNLSAPCPGSARTSMPSADGDWLLTAHVKPDTQHVKVAEKTITEKTEKVVVEKRMPDWGKYLIGGLVGFLLLMLMAMKIRGALQ